MRSLLAVLLSFTLLTCTFRSEVFAQDAKPETKPLASDFKPFQISPSGDPPVLMWECEGQQCISGGGGAIWVFEGNRGQGVWQYGAVADLNMQMPDKKKIMVHRSDPIASYSTQFTGGKQFTADYEGKVTNRSYEGTITVGQFPKDQWYGGFTDGICGVGDKCPLDARHIVELGENALHAKLYRVAFLSFKSAAAKGDYDGEAFAAVMMRDGAEGTPQNVPEALKMLEDSAENDNINGERGLAETYEFGLGVPKDPERAAFWKNRALARQREESRARAQAEINKRTNAAIGFTVFGLLFLGMIAVAGSSSDQTAESHDAKVYNETRRGQEIYREREWFYRGGGIAGPPSGWNVGDPIPER